MMYGSLAQRLRVLRAERGWTLNQAAERAGVQPETISDAEHGKRRPYTPTLAKIAAAYGVPVEELLEEPVPLGEVPQGTGRAEWDAAVRNARQLREYGRTRMQELLSSWRESKERGEAADARQGLRAAMGELLQEALDARSALQENASVPALDGIPLDKIPIPEFEEIAEADSLYWSLSDMVLGAVYLSIRRERKPDREVHEVEEAA
jgi:transcriptional regulator with XRE-family HTH domain